MPNFKAHCAISKKRTRDTFAELHQWIDHPPQANILGADHRIERHAYNQSDMNYIKSYWEQKRGYGWGDKAVIEWLFHIAIDNISTAFKLSKKHYGENTYNVIKIGITNSGFIHVDFERQGDYQLRKSFGK